MQAFDPYGVYCVVRFAEPRFGLRMNLGVVGFWRYGFHAEISSKAVSDLVRLRPDIDELDVRNHLDGLWETLGGSAIPFNPYETYYLMHTYKEENRRSPLVFSTLHRISVAEYSGIAAAMEDMCRHVVYQEFVDGEYAWGA